jgi:hypothetical protein
VFQKGNKLGKGRPKLILPEVQRAVDANRNALKVVILSEMENKAAEWIRRIIEQGIGEGDVIRFKALMEIALGKLVDDPPEFQVSEEEKLLVLEYRRRKQLSLESGSAIAPDRTDPETPET